MRTHTSKIAAVITTAVALGALMTGCGMTRETKSDAPEPTSDNIVNGTNTQIIRMPDGFRNVAFTCYGTVGVYVTSRGLWQQGNADLTTLPSSIALLPNDPHCPAK